MPERLPTDRGAVNPEKLPRGVNGRALCRQCRTETKPPRRTFCSDECVERWKERTDVGFQRLQVWKRDGGVCRLCGLDIQRLMTRVDQLETKLRFRESSWPLRPPRTRMIAFQRRRRLREILVRMGFAKAKGLLPHLWEMDHIVPVVRGGGGCDLSNLRVLCRPCHRTVTRELKQALAAEKKERLNG